MDIMVALKDAMTTGACPLRKIPLEVMETIFGHLNFPDLFAVLVVSDWIQVTPNSVREFF
jgi:hypothetical protein